MDGLEFLAICTVGASSIACALAWLGARNFDRVYGNDGRSGG